MKSLAIALGLVFAIAIALFAFGHWFGISDKVSGPLAGSALGFITFVHDRVEKTLSAGRSPVTPGIVPVAFFQISPMLMLVYISLIYVGIIEGTGLLIGAPLIYILDNLHVKGLSATAGFGAAALAELPLILWSIFVLGRWVGIRNARSAYWLLPCGLIIGRILDAVAVYLNAAARHTVMSVLSNVHSLITAIVVLLAALTLAVAASFLGAWRGNRIRFGAYFNSLLRAVSQPTRETLLQMAYEEAISSQSPSPPPLTSR